MARQARLGAERILRSVAAGGARHVPSWLLAVWQVWFGAMGLAWPGAVRFGRRDTPGQRAALVWYRRLGLFGSRKDWKARFGRLGWPRCCPLPMVRSGLEGTAGGASCCCARLCAVRMVRQVRHAWVRCGPSGSSGNGAAGKARRVTARSGWCGTAGPARWPIVCRGSFG